MPAPATLLEVDVAAPSHPRHLGPEAIQIRPDSTPRFRGPIQPRGRIPLGANLLRALDAMIPPGGGDSGDANLSGAHTRLSYGPNRTSAGPPRYLIRAEPVPIPDIARRA